MSVATRLAEFCLFAQPDEVARAGRNARTGGTYLLWAALVGLGTRWQMETVSHKFHA